MTEVAPPTALVRPPMISETEGWGVSAMERPGDGLVQRDLRVLCGNRRGLKAFEADYEGSKGGLTLPRFQLMFSLPRCLGDRRLRSGEDGGCVESGEREYEGGDGFGKHCMSWEVTVMADGRGGRGDTYERRDESDEAVCGMTPCDLPPPLTSAADPTRFDRRRLAQAVNDHPYPLPPAPTAHNTPPCPSSTQTPPTRSSTPTPTPGA